MNNSSSALNNSSLVAAPHTAAINPWLMLEYTVLIVIGAAIVILNTSVWLTILLSKDLRKQKELLIFCMLTVADSLDGWAHLTWAIRAALVMTLGWGPVTHWDCLKAPTNSFYIVGLPLSCIAMTCVSIDRLFSVTDLSSYIKLGNKYLVCMVGIPVATVLYFYISGWILGSQMSTTELVDPTCIMSVTLTPMFVKAYVWFQLIGSTSSVLVYSAVMLILRFQPKSNFRTVRASQMRKQNSITKLFGLMSICTLLTFVIPHGIQAAFSFAGLSGQTDFRYGIVMVLCNLVKAMHSVFYVAIYLSKPSSVRERLHKFLRRNLACRRNKINVVWSVSFNVRGGSRSKPGSVKFISIQS